MINVGPALISSLQDRNAFRFAKQIREGIPNVVGGPGADEENRRSDAGSTAKPADAKKSQISARLLLKKSNVDCQVSGCWAISAGV